MAGEIIKVDLAGALGQEKQKERPCVVVLDGPDGRSGLVVVAPLTDARQHKYMPIQVKVASAALGVGFKDSVVECGHLRAVDLGERGQGKLGLLGRPEMSRVLDAYRVSLGLKNGPAIRDYKRGDVVIADLSGAVGLEVGGSPTRCIVVQNDVGNVFSPLTIIVPVVDVEDGAAPGVVPVLGPGQQPDSATLYVDLANIRTLDKSRIARAVDWIPPGTMAAIDAALGVP